MRAIITDGAHRRRRQGKSPQAKWYAFYRHLRFQRRFGLNDSRVHAALSRFTVTEKVS